MTFSYRLIAGILALACLGACAPMQSHERPAADPPAQTQGSIRSSTDGNVAHTEGRCPSCGVVRSITQVAGGSVLSEVASEDGRFDVYRIDVDLNSGDSYSVDQRDAEGLQKGSSIEVRERHVYPRD